MGSSLSLSPGRAPREPPGTITTKNDGGGSGSSSSDGAFDVRRVAVVGAGPSGLAAAKHLLAVGAFERVDVFEQQAEVGGVWNYSAEPPPPDSLRVPQTDAHGPPDTPVIPSSSSEKKTIKEEEDGRDNNNNNNNNNNKGDSTTAPASPPPLFPGPMYDDLHTNIPHTLMQFSDLPFPASKKGEEEGEDGKGAGCTIFPHREVVQEYLVEYARDVRHLIKFSTQVVDITPISPPPPPSSSSSSLPSRAADIDGGGDGRRQKKAEVEAEKKEEEEVRGRERWAVRTKDLLSGAATTTTTATYDAVVVASGHYATPYVPAIEGLAAFAAAHPGAVSHSKLYRAPAEAAYGGRKVLVVGNAASGLDIAAQIRRVARRPVLVSGQTPLAAAAAPGALGDNEEVPEIRRFLVEERGVEFYGGQGRGGDTERRGGGGVGGGGGEEEKHGDGKGVAADGGIAKEQAPTGGEGERGRVETDIDVVLFCTGYLYTFPFLRSLSPGPGGPQPPLITDGRRVHGLARHLLHARHPTLAFAGLPSKAIPFPVAEAQMAVVARLWANLLPAPGRALLERWAREDEEAWRQLPPGERKGFHVLPRGGDGRYINMLHDWAAQAGAGTGGKEPPRWEEYELWQRSIYVEAKAQFEKTGKKARTLEELGFHFQPTNLGVDGWPEKDVTSAPTTTTDHAGLRSDASG